MAKKKLYAVRSGRAPGIYDTWDECKAQVDGFPGAEYKSFPTREAAEAYLSDGNGPYMAPRDPGLAQLDALAGMPEDTAIAYVDGSFDGRRYGSGAVVLYRGEEIELTRSGDDPEMAEMRNVAGEVGAARMAMEWCVAHGVHGLVIHHDYTGIAEWAEGRWKANKAGTRDYAAFARGLDPILKIAFQKVKGHSGDKYNDMADMLAKRSIGLAPGGSGKKGK